MAPGDLVALAQDFSPRFEVVAPDVVVVDVGGLDRLIGDVEAIGGALVRLAGERRLPLVAAIAPTRTAAIILALSDAAARRDDRPCCRSVEPDAVAAALAPLPVSRLAALLRVETADLSAPETGHAPRARRTRGSGRNYRLAPSPGASPLMDRQAPLADLLQTLQRWGLRTLGALAALPPVDVFERLGSSGVAWQAVARGEDARPLVRTVPGDPFEATMTLEWPVETLEPLSFVLAGLLEPLCARLERAERGVAVLQTTLLLVDRTLHVRTLELPAPMRDVRALRTLILLDLESHPPGTGIDRVTVSIEPAPERIVQHSLLARARPSPDRIATLTARLTAVLGEWRVGRPALVDSYAAEAFAMQAFDGDAERPDRGRTTQAAGSGRQIGESTPEARAAAEAGRAIAWQTGFVLRRFRPPLPVRVERARGRPVRLGAVSRGVSGGRIVQAAGPWRTSGAWWTRVEVGRRKEEGGSRKEEGGRRKEEQGARHKTQDTRLTTRDTGIGVQSSSDNDAHWDCDEWDVVVADGTALRLACNRATGEWTVEGMLD